MVYFLGLAITVISFPSEKRKKLFYESPPPKGRSSRIYLIIGRIAAVVFNLLMIWTPFQVGTFFFLVGSIVYLLGFIIVMIALHNFKRAPVDQIVTRGLYRFSRNPQWIGLVLVFLGVAFAVASWLHLGLLLVLILTYHFQILAEEEDCVGFYGEDYHEYMRLVPRYL